MLRPEHLRVLDADARADVAFDAEVTDEFVLGSRTRIQLRAGERTLLTELGTANPPLIGSRRRFGFDLADASFVRE